MINKVTVNGLKKIQKLVRLVKIQYRNIQDVPKLNVFVGLNFVMNVIRNGINFINLQKDNVHTFNVNLVQNNVHQHMIF